MECWLSEIDLNGILFSEFPDDLTLEECRERLELEIEETFDELETPRIVEDVDLLPDGTARFNGKMLCVNPPRISAYAMTLVAHRRAHRELDGMTQHEYRAHLDSCLIKRAARFQKNANGETNNKEKHNAQTRVDR